MPGRGGAGGVEGGGAPSETVGERLCRSVCAWRPFSAYWRVGGVRACVSFPYTGLPALTAVRLPHLLHHTHSLLATNHHHHHYPHSLLHPSPPPPSAPHFAVVLIDFTLLFFPSCTTPCTTLLAMDLVPLYRLRLRASVWTKSPTILGVLTPYKKIAEVPLHHNLHQRLLGSPHTTPVFFGTSLPNGR